MEWIESILATLRGLPPVGILGAIFLVAYIENVFPPSPSDLMIVFAGTLVGVGTVGFLPALGAATAGGTLGFMTAYAAGRYFERRLTTGRLGRYLPLGGIHQAERLFQRYGYWVIIANRFLAGTRAVVSFFAGMSRLHLPRTSVLSAISAAVWNSLLLYAGMSLAGNWRRAIDFLEVYSKVATIVVAVATAIFLWWYFRRRRAAPPREN